MINVMFCIDSFVSGIASSLPIPIGPIGHTKIKFGHLEYQVKTSLADRPGIIVPAFQKSTSEAMRRASYAQRDLARPMDPGALDFASIEEGDEEDEAVDSELDGVGGKGRQRALKILKARNEIPDAGEPLVFVFLLCRWTLTNFFLLQACGVVLLELDFHETEQ